MDKAERQELELLIDNLQAAKEFIMRDVVIGTMTDDDRQALDYLQTKQDEARMRYINTDED